MEPSHLPKNPYLLLTPGPLSTSQSVKAVMLRDWCTWDDDYNHEVVQEIRSRLVKLATSSKDYSSVLMQGSGTFSVEATIGSVMPEKGKLLILANGAYGQRLIKIADRLKIATVVHDTGETNWPDLNQIKSILQNDSDVTHVIMVHCETTTGMLNPIAEIGALSKEYDKILIVDAMSSFGGIPMDLDQLGIDYLISSANKCIQGVPGFGFVIARTAALESIAGFARSLALDLHDQWQTMETFSGKWRYTSPTHTVRAFLQALIELENEGGVEARHHRYTENQRTLVEIMNQHGFHCLLPKSHHSPIITSFHNPTSPTYSFKKFYDRLKAKGFVIYPGKVSVADTFRIGNIGHIFPDDIQRLGEAITKVKDGLF